MQSTTRRYDKFIYMYLHMYTLNCATTRAPFTTHMGDATGVCGGPTFGTSGVQGVWAGPMKIIFASIADKSLFSTVQVTVKVNTCQVNGI